MSKPLYRELASTIGALKRCDAKRISGGAQTTDASRNADEWYNRHSDTIALLMDHMPSGSGIDNGTKLDLDGSHEDKLVFTCGYHHMNDAGYYDGWTEHTITVTPSFQGIHMRISGRNRNDIKEYLYQTFDYALNQDMKYWLLLQSASNPVKIEYRQTATGTQQFQVIRQLRVHTYAPNVGDHIKLRTIQDYMQMNLHAWSWMRVINSYENQYMLEVLNGDKPTGVYVTVSLDAIATPSTWTPTFDTDEILGTFNTLDAAKDYAVTCMKAEVK